MKKPRIYTTSFATIYPLYLAKAERKGRTQADVDEVIRWLTGYDQQQLEAELAAGVDYETFLFLAPQMNPARRLITGRVCGVRVEDVEDPIVRDIRYLDLLIDELARGKEIPRIIGWKDDN